MARQALNDEQCKTVCKYFYSAHRSAIDQCTVVSWFHPTYHWSMYQSQVSKILRKKYTYLETLQDGNDLNQKNRPSCHWLELQEALFTWQQAMQQKGVALGGELLKLKASEFWSKLSVYKDQDAPVFSNGWLERFKHHRKVRAYARHGEARSVNAALLEQGLQATREITAMYNKQDIYNLDKTALFWKMMPERSLATESASGVKVQKSCITLAVCGDADRSDKVPLWSIGQYANPRCFRLVNHDSLGCVYQYNLNACINITIMVEWLEWFNRRMNGRHVVLLLDNFSAHACALEALELKNVRVEFLPLNTTLLCQPCDQGIIYALKGYYRRHFTRWCLEEWEEGREPLAGMNLLMAIKRAVVAWDLEVKRTTMSNGFKKSSIPLPEDESDNDVESDDESTYSETDTDCQQIQADLTIATAQLVTRRRIPAGTSVNDYVNSAEEAVHNPDDDLVTHIVAAINIVNTEAAEDMLDEAIQNRITHKSVLTSVGNLIAYAQQNQTSERD